MSIVTVLTFLVLASLIAFLVPQFFGVDTLAEIKTTVLRRFAVVVAVPGAAVFLIVATIFDLLIVTISTRDVAVIKSEALVETPLVFRAFFEDVAYSWKGA